MVPLLVFPRIVGWLLDLFVFGPSRHAAGNVDETCAGRRIRDPETAVEVELKPRVAMKSSYIPVDVSVGNARAGSGGRELRAERRAAGGGCAGVCAVTVPDRHGAEGTGWPRFPAGREQW